MDALQVRTQSPMLALRAAPALAQPPGPTCPTAHGRPPQDPALERCFRGHRDGVTSVAFNSNMRQVVSGGADGAVMLWHFKPTLRAFRFLGHRGAVTCVAYDPTHNLVASASKDKTVRLWTPSAEGRSTVLKAHTAAVRGVAFSQNGRMLLTCSDDKTVKVSMRSCGAREDVAVAPSLPGAGEPQ